MTKHISLVGVGVLGKAIALRLRQCQYTLSLYNRTASKAEALTGSGVHAVSSLSQLLTRKAPIILICLTDAQATKTLFCTPEIKNKLEECQPLIVNISTIGPKIASTWRRFSNDTALTTSKPPFPGAPKARAPANWLAG
nr:NAD(P)-binding domain-containing protein [Lonsdalea britannica]